MPEDPQIIKECLAMELEQKIMEIVVGLIHIKNMAVYRAAVDEIRKLLHKLETLDEAVHKIVYGEE